MKTNYSICVSVLFALLLSCNTEEEHEKLNNFHENQKTSFLTIDQITEIPKFLVWHTKIKTDHFLSQGYKVDVKNSMLISYTDSPIRAIFTRLNPDNDRSDETYHVYFMLDNLVSVFDIVIQSEHIGLKTCRYTFLNIYGEKIGFFELDQEDGRILNTMTGFTRSKKDWLDRFENCLEWTIDNMNTYDKIACFAFGPVCAGIIATMCAVGASEDNFETPDQP